MSTETKAKNRRENKMNKLLIAALLTITFDSTQAKGVIDKDIEKTLSKVVNDINLTLSKMADKNNRLDSVVAGPGLLITYIFSSPEIFSTDTLRSYVTHYLTVKKPQVKNTLCTNPNAGWFFKSGITVRYQYFFADGVYMGSINVTPKDCGNITAAK
jgi:hypothetical protein